MYSSGGIVCAPSSTIAAPSWRLASASSTVGSSSCNPLTYTTSACDKSSATLGLGSNVWELVPSGTIPVTSARSPTMLETMLVIGATVVAITSRSPPADAPSSSPAQALIPGARRRTVTRAAAARRIAGT